MRERGPSSERRAWLWPPALALVAIGLQLLIDVPHHAMVADDPEPKSERTTTAARTPRTWKPRGAEYSKRLRKSWASRPIADEPVDPSFAEHHEDLLRAIVRKAEATAVPFEEPNSITTHPVCHTIRCELEVCGPPEIADAIVEQLPRFRVSGRSLWHELRKLASDKPSDDDRSCHRYIVGFAVEGADPRKLQLTPTRAR